MCGLRKPRFQEPIFAAPAEALCLDCGEPLDLHERRPDTPRRLVGYCLNQDCLAYLDVLVFDVELPEAVPVPPPRAIVRRLAVV